MRASGPFAFALLHGGGQGSWVWDEVVRLLAVRGGRVLALDVPGCGTKRGRDVAALSADEVARELIADIEVAGLEQVVLVGHSLAGAILPRMAEFAPERIARLVYLTCSAPLPGVSFRGQMGEGLQGSHPDQVGWPVDPEAHSADERYRLMFCNDMSEAEATAFLAKMGHDIWPMDPLTCTDHRYDHLAGMPSTYVVCRDDAGLPPHWQRRFAQRLHCGKVLEFASGHQAMTTRPEALADLLWAEGVCLPP